jgi:hypothetical protein
VKPALVVLSFLSFANVCQGASGSLPESAGAAALGGASIAGPCATLSNVAATYAHGLELDVSWANPYGIEGLYSSSLWLKVGWGRAGCAVSIRSLDTPTAYGETSLAASISFSLAERASIGAGGTICWLSDAAGPFEAETGTSLGLSLGRPGDLGIGCAVATPLGRGGGAAYRWGVSVPLAGRTVLVFEEERLGGWPVRRLGGETCLTDFVILRAGVADDPVVVGFGLGLRARGADLSVAVTQHEVLGATPYVTISYGMRAWGR